ncbi:hypothetical protein M770_31935 (plasmid) [Pseudomonas aeruginosa VRFPA03]|nr:hypothetical protein M770_31935 [Pseudomonas aeruginosa VRFPA03]
MSILAERLVIPDGQSAGDLQTIHCLAMLGAELMGGSVAFDAQSVEQAADVLIQLDLAAELVE